MSNEEPPVLSEKLYRRLKQELEARRNAERSPPSPMEDPYRPTSTPKSLPRWQQLFLDVLAGLAGRDRDPDHALAKIGEFEALGSLGNGSHGCVYKVRDTELDRIAALKLCLVESPDAAKALMAEAQVLAKLRHPNIVTVYETGKHGEDVFFVMQYVDGPTLAKYAFEGKQHLSWEELVEVFCVLGEALATAHDTSVVHGDFKPSNVIIELESKMPFIVDFGLAGVVREDDGGGGMRGTLHYAAPEVLRGERCRPRADQYSFCVSLWQCLDGGLTPYGGHDSEDLLIDIEAGSPPFRNRAAPERLREVLRRGMSFDVEERYPDMHALVRELRLLLGPRLVVEPRPAAAEVESKNNSGLVALVVALAVGLVLQHLLPGKEQAEQSAYVDDPDQLETSREAAPDLPDHAATALAKDCVEMPWRPSSKARGVCTLIHEHNFEGAHALWKDAHEAASPESVEEWKRLIQDVVSVSKTFEAAKQQTKANTWRAYACDDYKTARGSFIEEEAEELLSSALVGVDCS